MDGTPRPPIQGLAKAKGKVRYLWCDYLQTSGGYLGTWSGVDFLNVATHLLRMILVRERTLSHPPSKSHQMQNGFRWSCSAAWKVSFSTPTGEMDHSNHEFWIKLGKGVVIWLLSTAAVPNEKYSQLGCCAVFEVLLLLRCVTVNLKYSRS